jgi:hypothetical protein
MDKGTPKEVTNKQTKETPKHFRIIIKLPLWMHVDKSFKSHKRKLKKWQSWKRRELPKIVARRDSLQQGATASARSLYDLYLSQIAEEGSRFKSDVSLLEVLASMSTLLEEHQHQIIRLEDEVMKLWRQKSATKSVMTRRTKQMAQKIEETLSPIKAAFDELANEIEVPPSDAKRLWA